MEAPAWITGITDIGEIDVKISALKSERSALFNEYDRARREAIQIDELVQQLQKRKAALLGEQV